MSPALPGWYGKLPALGDFASRRLPTGFIQRWDAWLQRELAESNRRLGAAWNDKYLNAPIWRFGLSCGVCGREAWMGVLMPSVDRAGRHFPLTVALPLEPGTEISDAVLASDAWYEAVERAMLGALDVHATVEGFEQSLRAVRTDLTVDADATWPGGAGPVARRPGRNLYPTARGPDGNQALLDDVRTCTLWWTTAMDDADAPVRVYPDLPQGTDFRQLLEAAYCP